MFPYMALTAVDNHVPFDSIHSKIYRDAKHEMPFSDFVALSQRQPALAANASEFQLILKYFAIKPGYLAVTRTLYHAGFSLVAATYLPSVASYILIGCLLFWWLERIFSPLVASALALLLAATPFLITPARYSSPDLLSTFLSLAGIFIATVFSAPTGLALMFLAIPVRPDSVIMFLCAASALYASGRAKGPYVIIACLLAAATTYAVLNGTALLKEFAFTSSSFSQEWTTGQMTFQYFSGLIKGLQSISNSGIVIFSFLGCAAIILSPDKTWRAMIIAMLVTFPIRYVLHPWIEDRFMTASYLVIFVGFCMAIQPYLPSKYLTPIQPKNLS
jgi:hypothetical protein